jgi:hypothetical protein
MTPFFPANNLTSFRNGYLKSSSLPRPLKDIKIIPAGFAGLVISEGFGKLVAQGHLRYYALLCNPPKNIKLLSILLLIL